MPAGFESYWDKYGKDWNKQNPNKRREISRRYYWNHHDKVLKEQTERNRKRRDFIQNYKLSKGCEICGYKKCADGLSFHHLGDSKEFALADSISAGISLERIKKEMEKCMVVCMNCHAEIHEQKNAEEF